MTAREALLEQLVARAEAAWPDLELDVGGFVEWMSERAGDDAALAALAVEDLYLAYGCAQQHPRALERFEAEVFGAAAAELRQLDGSGDLVVEVRQRLFERLLTAPEPRIRQYKGTGPLKGWVRAAAVRIALNLRRRETVDARALRMLGPNLLGPADPELEIVRHRYGGAVEGALRRALRVLDAEQRTLLRLHYLDGVPLEHIGAMYKASKTTVWRWLDAARRALLEETKRLLIAELNVSGETLNSLLGMLASRINITLSALFTHGDRSPK